MKYTEGQPEAPRAVYAVCECCRVKIIIERVWVQLGRGRKGVCSSMVTIIKAVDKTIELWSGGKMQGLMPVINGRNPTLATTAAKLGGKWISICRDVWVRPESITHWWPNEERGATLLVDGARMISNRRQWPQVRKAIEQANAKSC
jgi:hypothetical protein